MGRLDSTKALLGPEVFEKVRTTPVLVVGAGGIGCELLKNLVLVGFSNIEIIDLDTIDLSNLNRQFLFRKPDISKPKALIAAATARHFNPSSGIHIHARHGNVKDGQNDLEWIKGFGLVMNALDNMDARRHVNKLCQAAGVPLVESGTAGYLGQVTPILRDQTECFDCLPKQTPKTFPVCTIRATPSEPIHCIVWAKTYLFGKLFGEDDEALDTEELDRAQAAGENAEEIEELKQEAAAFREVRLNLGEEDGPKRVFDKVFNDDIKRLLAMADMWKVAGRVKPTALERDKIMDGTFIVPPVRKAAAPATGNGHANGSNGEAENQAGPSSKQLRDQRELSIRENLELFIDSCRRLSARSIAHPNVVLTFDKDDDDTLDFVLATANLRAMAYAIPTKTRFQVKEMAGNIIPAIATTNAIVAGLIVMQAINLLSQNISRARNVFLRADPSKPLGTFVPQKPNEACAVCRDVYIPFKVDTTKCTLGKFVAEVVKRWLDDGIRQGSGGPNGQANGNANGNGAADEEEDDANDDEELEWGIFEGPRILADPDFDDNYEKTLSELEVERGKMLTVRDEDGKYRPIHFCILDLDSENGEVFSLPSSVPIIPKAPPPKPSESRETSSSPDIVEEVRRPTRKRAADEDEDEDGEKGPKKRRVVGGSAKEVVDVASDDVIVID